MKYVVDGPTDPDPVWGEKNLKKEEKNKHLFLFFVMLYLLLGREQGLYLMHLLYRQSRFHQRNVAFVCLFFVEILVSVLTPEDVLHHVYFFFHAHCEQKQKQKQKKKKKSPTRNKITQVQLSCRVHW